MPSTDILPEARDELVESASWYDHERVGLGDAFVASVLESFDRIEQSPLMYTIHFRDLRRASVSRFPYSVYYRVVESRITIVAVFHNHRDISTLADRQ